MILLLIQRVSIFCYSLERVCQKSGFHIKIAACPHHLVSLRNMQKIQPFFDSFTQHCPATLSHSKLHSYGCHNILLCVACDADNLLRYIRCRMVPLCLQVPAICYKKPAQLLLEWCRSDSSPLLQPTRGSGPVTPGRLGHSHGGCGDQPSSHCTPPPPRLPQPVINLTKMTADKC